VASSLVVQATVAELDATPLEVIPEMTGGVVSGGGVEPVFISVTASPIARPILPISGPSVPSE